MNEKDIIQQYFTKDFNDREIIEGIGDDAAIIKANNGCELVITTDTMTVGQHFSKQAPAYAVGYKLMASNISDIAAMGAAPRWATLNLTLTSLDQSWLEGFSRGLFECAEINRVTLIGGDTTAGDSLTMSVQLIGEVPIGKALLRSHAKVNDKLFVTGVIGNAVSALNYLQETNFNHDDLSDEQYTALYTPQSRVDLSIEMRELANAAIDISDGLLNELDLICHASNVGACLQIDKIPMEHEKDAELAITGGEDYELLFTIPDEKIHQLDRLSSKYNCPITQIGKITDSQIIEIYQGDQVIPRPHYLGYDHFEK